MASFANNMAYIATIIVIVLVGFDGIRGLFFLKSKDYNSRDIVMNLMIGTVNFIFRHVMALSLFSLAVALGYNHHLFEWDSSSLWTWFWCFLILDFLGYLRHYWLHRVRLLWAVHVVHHSSETFNHSVELRSSLFTEWVRAPFYGLVCVFGFPPAMVIIILSATAIYDVFLHNPRIKSLGILELIFMTPSHHRVHHGCNPQYLDKNFGFVLIIWDRLFGTYAKEVDQVVYGVVNQPKKSSLLDIFFGEWAALAKDLSKSTSLEEVWGYLVRPPGWRPGPIAQISPILFPDNRSGTKIEKV